MNELTIHGGNAEQTTMSSREIAELTGKRHPDVKRDIRNMLEALGKGVSSFAHTYKDAQNKEQEEYALDRELTLTLVSGYDIPLRHRVVTRLAELENEPKALNPANLSRLQLIELAMQAEQERLALEHKVEELAPKAEALDRIATFSDGTFCIRDSAKILQFQEKQLYQLLVEEEWIYRRPMGAGWLAYSDKLQQLLMEHKVTEGQKTDGSGDWKSIQPRITAKGLAKLAKIIERKSKCFTTTQQMPSTSTRLKSPPSLSMGM